MLLEIPRLVRDLLPGDDAAGAMSVACVHTTRPKYLVFEGDQCRPAYVVQFGPGEQMTRTHHALEQLSARVGDAVPRSVVCTEVGRGEYVHIQTGLAGLPWFRVADGCRSRADWLNLLQRSLAVLERLQAAIAGVPEWTGYIRPGRELRARLQASGEIHGDAAVVARRWAEALDCLGSVPAAHRHGDFSLNNLLIGDAAIGIIDFDEFGDTMMPLHDEIGLALSLPLSQHGVCPLSVAECLQMCLEPSIAKRVVPRGAVPGLLLHHLLWRIERCRAVPARAGLRATLTRYMGEVLSDPRSILGPGFASA